MRTIRWGILATGGIAGTFAETLREAPGAELAAVGSRDIRKAEVFAEKHGAARAHGSYAELAADPQVEAVYVATPHSRHEEDTLLCLGQGKAVLCEKPFAVNAAQAGRMIDAARRAGTLLMEAMWTRFLPSIVQVRERIAAGAIGPPRLLQADFGFRAPFDPQGRLFNPHLAGGALLDLGVYAVSLGHALFGPPVRIKGTARTGATGVDEQGAFILDHGAGRFTLGFHSLCRDTPREAVIRGTEGEIRLPEPWWGAERFLIERADGGTTLEEFEMHGRGYAPMAEAFMQMLREGRLESPVVSLKDSLAVMKTLDALRACSGLRYPFE